MHDSLTRVEIPGPGDVASDGRRLEEVWGGEDLLLVRSWGRADVVVASPHHAPKGVPYLFGTRVADENAGFVADRVAELLDGRAVIACRSRTHDPNKQDGAYMDEVLRRRVAALVEIHGHRGVRPPGPGRRARFDVEVSTGSARTQGLAEALVARLDTLRAACRGEAGVVLRALTISAAWDEIFLRATGTESLRRARRAGVPTLHVELPPALRLDRAHAGLPAAGAAFADLLASALESVLAV